MNTAGQTIVEQHPCKGGCGTVIFAKFREFCNPCTFQRKAARDKARRREKREAKQQPQDDHDTPEYHAFLAECAKHCRCTHSICDGVLAGGMCDEIIDEED